MEKTREYIKGQYEYYDNEYWRVFGRFENSKKEFENAKREFESLEKELKRLDAERNLFEKMYNEISENDAK